MLCIESISVLLNIKLQIIKVLYNFKTFLQTIKISKSILVSKEQCLSSWSSNKACYSFETRMKMFSVFSSNKLSVFSTNMLESLTILQKGEHVLWGSLTPNEVRYLFFEVRVVFYFDTGYLPSLHHCTRSIFFFRF